MTTLIQSYFRLSSALSHIITGQIISKLADEQNFQQSDFEAETDLLLKHLSLAQLLKTKVLLHFNEPPPPPVHAVLGLKLPHRKPNSWSRQPHTVGVLLSLHHGHCTISKIDEPMESKPLEKLRTNVRF